MWTVTALAGNTILGEWSLKMMQIKVSHNSQLYSEHQTIYILSIKQSQMSKGHKI